MTGPQPPRGNGPSGSSQRAPGEVRFDEVGYARPASLGGVSVAVAGQQPGSYVEVTALDSGRTILALVTGEGFSGDLALLSPGAASALGITARAPVRVRGVTPSPRDAALLNQGKLASGRMDAPQSLLGPLRKRLAQAVVQAPAGTAAISITPAPAPVKVPAKTSVKAPSARPKPAAAASRAGYYVQVAALSSRARANALAATVGGIVEPTGTLFRVRLGPFPDTASADRSRAKAVRRGYPDARIVRID